MRILVWQWGRFGSGPRYALELAGALSALGHETQLSLAAGAELMQDRKMRSAVDLPLHTYASRPEFITRSLIIRGVLGPIIDELRAKSPDVAIVTMMGYWDIVFIRSLQRIGVPVVVMLHDAEVHPGDRFHLMVRLQRRIIRMSEGVITLTAFVANQIKARLSLAEKIHTTIPHPAFAFADLDLPRPQLPAGALARPLRLLIAGRLKRYKGLELLTDALKQMGNMPLRLRVVGAVQDESDLTPLAD